MKKALTIISLCALSLMAAEQSTPLKGFLGVQSCVENGLFTDCGLNNYAEGGKLVAVIDGKTYKIDKQTIKQGQIDPFIMKSDINFQGIIVADTLKLNALSFPVAVSTAPKEKHKGCM